MSTLTRGMVLALFMAPGLLAAQDADHAWQKSYAISSRPTLRIETGDASLEVRGCATCRTVQIHVKTGRRLSEYRLEESQSGDRIAFLFREKMHLGGHANWRPSDRAYVVVETPVDLSLEARSGDGSVSLHDLHGEIDVHNSDGSVAIAKTEGNLRVTSGDGNVEVRDASGTIEARNSDGRLTVDGRFSQFQLHTSDGNVELTLAEGSKLTAASRVESSDGRVVMRLPHSLAADVDLSASDGHVECALPLTVKDYNSRSGGHHHLAGKLNGGGVPLVVHSSDGSVSITPL